MRHYIVLMLSLGLAAYNWMIMEEYSGFARLAASIGMFLVSLVILSVASGFILGMMGHDPVVEHELEEVRRFTRLLPEKARKACQVLVLAQCNIEDGIHWRLLNRYEKEDPGVDPYDLARAVVATLLLDREATESLGDFPERHADLIRKEVCRAVADERIRDALSFEHAGRLMALAEGDDSAQVIIEAPLENP